MMGSVIRWQKRATFDVVFILTSRCIMIRCTVFTALHGTALSNQRWYIWLQVCGISMISINRCEEDLKEESPDPAESLTGW